MASIIIFSTLWGIFFKEWRGAKALTKSLVVVMLLFLVGSTCIIGWGNKFSEDAANAKAAAKATQATQTAAEINAYAAPCLQDELEAGRRRRNTRRRHDEIWPELAAALTRGGRFRLLDFSR